MTTTFKLTGCPALRKVFQEAAKELSKRMEESLREVAKEIAKFPLDQHEIIDRAIKQVLALGELPDLGEGGKAYLIQAALKLHEVRRRAPKHPRHPAYIEPEESGRCERGCPLD